MKGCLFNVLAAGVAIVGLALIGQYLGFNNADEVVDNPIKALKKLQTPPGTQSSSSAGGSRVATTNPYNIVKVLNRVQCSGSYAAGCFQASIDERWSACIRNGFTETPPTRSVKSAREIKELIRYTFNITNKRPKITKKVDPLGMVTEMNEGYEEYKELITATTYCLGTEYIL